MTASITGDYSSLYDFSIPLLVPSFPIGAWASGASHTGQ